MPKKWLGEREIALQSSATACNVKSLCPPSPPFIIIKNMRLLSLIYDYIFHHLSASQCCLFVLFIMFEKMIAAIFLISPPLRRYSASTRKLELRVAIIWIAIDTRIISGSVHAVCTCSSVRHSRIKTESLYSFIHSIETIWAPSVCWCAAHAMRWLDACSGSDKM